MFTDPDRYDIEEFLKIQQWEYKVAGPDEWKIETCPYCGKDKWHFYMSQNTSQFECKVCGEKGNLWKLKKDFGHNLLQKIANVKPTPTKAEVYPNREKMKRMIEALKVSKKAMAYLQERGFTEETILAFNLGLSEDGKIAIPIIKDKKLVSIKYRSVPPADKFYMREKDCPSYLFNGDSIIKDKSVILTEGEFDTMAAKQMGFNAVSGITGASGLVEAEMKQLDKAKKVVVIYDSDEPGQKGSRSVIDRIGLERCVNVVLPVKDMNEFMLKYGDKANEKLKILINEAEKVKPETVFSFSELLKEARNQTTEKGIPLGYAQLDSRFSGLGPGKLCVVAADTRVGKSTFTNNIAVKMALNNEPVLIFSLENQPTETVKRITSILAGKPWNDIHPEDIAMMEAMYESWPMYFYFSGDKDLDVSMMRELAIQAKKYYGIKAIIIDHIQFFSRSANNQTQELSLLVLQLKRLAVTLGIPVVVVSHISRKDREGRIPNIHDLKGSSSIEQDADQVLVLWRNLDPIDKPDELTSVETEDYERKQNELLVRIHKDRNGPGYGDFWFNYDLPTGKITEVIR